MARAAPLQSKADTGPRKTRAGPKAVPSLVQTKLDVGPARDRFENEADRIADRVMQSDPSRPSAPPAISRLTAPSAQRVAAEDPRVSSKRNEVKTMKVNDEKEDDSTVVQKKGDGPVAAPARAETAIGHMRAAGGNPLGPSVRGRMESGLGRSLNHVRVHNTPAAARAAKDVGARAFTVGNDVFFGAGQYRPDTHSGQRLLAHELVHTEQQKGLGHRAQTMALQRDPPAPTDNTNTDPPDPGPNWTKAGDTGTRIELDTTQGGGTLYLARLQVPNIHGGFKGISNHPVAPGVARSADVAMTASQPFTYSGKTAREVSPVQEFQKTQYYAAAENQVEPTLATAIPDAVEGWATAPEVERGGERVRYLRLKRIGADRTTTLIIGTAADIADHKRVKIPNWDRTGGPASFDVDHIQELQLCGLDGWNNFWLLDSQANRSSGRNINTKLQEDINAAIQAADRADFWEGPNADRKPSFQDFKNESTNWKVQFAGFRDLSIDNPGGPYWTRDEITTGVHLSHLTVLTEPELVAGGFLGDGSQMTNVSVFTSQAGGYRKIFDINNGQAEPRGSRSGFFGGFDLETVVMNPDEAAAPRIIRLDGTMFRRRRGQAINPTAMTGDNGIPVRAGDDLGFSGYLDQGFFREKLRSIPKDIVGASPITFEDAGINEDGNIYAVGFVTATKALFPNLTLPIYVLGNDIFIEFPIPTERLNFGPVSVTEANLRLGVGDNGIFVEGNAALIVQSVGEGSVTARVERDNTIISGTFNFDLDFLDPAQATITYNYGEDTLTLSLTAGVQRGTLPGIDSGTVTATFSRESIAISGQLNVGGALRGTVVTVSYSQEEGLRAGADNIPLPVERIPGISSATASLYAQRDPSTGEWTFGGTGTAVVAIAGASGEITIGVDGDRIIFRGNLNVAKGPASGSLSLTATNAPMDEDGNVVEGEATDTITVFGRGTAEITFGRILRGSATIILSPDASITISGTIGLPPTFEVFPRREYNKDLFTIETPDFPIWGVSLGGVGIGIFAFADATISFNSFVGPGELVDTEITATMDLDAPADATITGSARFTVPAFAGLRLDLGGGLRARVAVAFVEGRVGLDGELGVEADASAGVDVAWNRTDGLSVEAEVEANARPKFRLGINASVTAGVDLVLTEITKTWGPWRRTLGEFGPDMELGVTIPVAWNEQNGLDFSIDDIEVRQPQINARELLGSAFDTLV